LGQSRFLTQSRKGFAKCANLCVRKGFTQSSYAMASADDKANKVSQGTQSTKPMTL